MMVTARLTAVLSSPVTVPLTLPTGPGRAPATTELCQASPIDAGSTIGTGTVSTREDADEDDETLTVDAGYAAFFGADGQPGHRDGDDSGRRRHAAEPCAGGCRRQATFAWFSLVARLF